MPHRPAKIISFLLCFLLIFEQSGFAQVAGQLDISSHILNLRNSLIQDKFRPLHLRYLSYDNVNNNFRLLLDKGDWLKGALPKEQDLEGATKTLLNYFFIGITLPNDSFWVNLRPDSPGNIIDSALAMTDVGKILLEADLQLKKDTAKFTSPETAEGKKYWGKLYQKAEEIFGTSNITIPTLTRPWIVPGEIIIREAEDNAYIYKATLKVCLEQDYLKESATYNFKDERLKQLNEYSSQLIRELIIPKLTKEINCSKRYASLRQVYYSLILAQWFKQKFYGKGGLYASLIDRHNLTGLTSKTDWAKTTYFKEYQKSFKDGEYNIEEQVDSISGKTFRTYFSGGIAFANTIIPAITAGAVRGNPNRPISNASPKIIGVEVGGGTVVNPSGVELRKVEIKEEALGSQSDTTLGSRNIGSGQIKDKAGQGQGKQEEKKLKKPSLFRRIITSIILTSVILNFFASRNLIFAATSRAFQEKTRIEKEEKATPMVNKMIDSFSPGEWKETMGLYKNKDFQDKTIKLSHANRFSLARAIVYTLRRFDAPANDENINKVLPFILKTRENYSSRVILDKSKNFIIASHKEFGFGYITELPKSFGIEKYEMFKPANSEDVAAVKQAFIKSVENSPFNTTILLEGHGGQNHFWLDGGEIGEHASYDLHKPEAISYKELAEALINRAKSHNGKLSDLTILVESCFSANFIVNTLNTLAEEHNKGAIEDLPVIITAVNRNSTGYVGNFIADIQRAAQYGEYKGKLTLSDVYKAEETADYLQDYAFFLPVSKEELKELAQTLAEGKNEEHPPYIQLEATRIDPSLPIIDGQIGKRAQLESIDLQKNEIKVRDSAGAARVISLVAQARLDVAAVKSQIEAMQSMKEEHKKIILEVLSLLEKSPPSLYTFTSLVEDFFGFASKKDNLIAIHQSFLDNPIAIFHEIGEYLVQSGALNLTLEGNSLNISVNGQQFSLVLQGETLAIAQKDPTNPHYLLRALQREMFGEKDRALTHEIKKKQNTPSRIAAAFVDYYNNLANKIGQFSERFSKKAKLHKQLLKALRRNEEDEGIKEYHVREILRQIFNEDYRNSPLSNETSGHLLYSYKKYSWTYPLGLTRCINAGLDLTKAMKIGEGRYKDRYFGWRLDYLVGAFNISQSKGNRLLEVLGDDGKFEQVDREIAIERAYGAQWANFVTQAGWEVSRVDEAVSVAKRENIEPSVILDWLQKAYSKGQDDKLLLSDLKNHYKITRLLLEQNAYDHKIIYFVEGIVEDRDLSHAESAAISHLSVAQRLKAALILKGKIQPDREFILTLLNKASWFGDSIKGRALFQLFMQLYVDNEQWDQGVLGTIDSQPFMLEGITYYLVQNPEKIQQLINKETILKKVLLMMFPQLEKGVYFGKEKLDVDILCAKLKKERRFRVPGYFSEYTELLNAYLKQQNKSFETDNYQIDQEQAVGWSYERTAGESTDDLLSRNRTDRNFSGHLAMHQTKNPQLFEVILTAGYLIPADIFETLNAQNKFQQMLKEGKVASLIGTEFVHFSVDKRIGYLNTSYAFVYPLEMLLENQSFMLDPLSVDDWAVGGFSANPEHESHKIPVTSAIILIPKSEQEKTEKLFDGLEQAYPAWKRPRRIFYYTGQYAEDGLREVQEKYNLIQSLGKVRISKTPEVIRKLQSGKFKCDWVSRGAISLLSIKDVSDINGVIKYHDITRLSRLREVQDFSGQLEGLTEDILFDMAIGEAEAKDTGSSKRGTYQERISNFPDDFDLMVNMSGAIPADEDLQNFAGRFASELQNRGWLKVIYGEEEYVVTPESYISHRDGRSLVKIKIFRGNEKNIPVLSIDINFFSDSRGADGVRYQEKFWENFSKILARLPSQDKEEGKQHMLSVIRSLKAIFKNNGIYSWAEGGLRGVGTEQLVIQLNGVEDEFGTPKAVVSLDELKRIFSVNKALTVLEDAMFNGEEYAGLAGFRKNLPLWDPGSLAPTRLTDRINESSLKRLIDITTEERIDYKASEIATLPNEQVSSELTSVASLGAQVSRIGNETALYVAGQDEDELSDIVGAMAEGERTLFDDIKERMEKVADRRGGWGNIISTLEEGRTNEDLQAIDNALNELQKAGLITPEQAKNIRERIILVNVKESRLQGKNSKLGGLVVRHNGVLKILFPRSGLMNLTKESLGDFLHELVEIGLLEQGMKVDDAHWHALQVRDAFVSEQKEQALTILQDLRDQCRSGKFEQTFAVTLSDALNKVLSKDKIAGIDFSKLSESDVTNIVKEFLQGLEARGWRAPPEFKERFARILNILITGSQIKDFKSHFGHFDTADFILVLQRLHTLIENLSEFGIREEVLPDFPLYAVIAAFPKNNAEKFLLLQQANLAGESWDKLEPSQDILGWLKTRQIDKVIAKLLGSRVSAADIKAVVVFFGIDIGKMQGNFILNLILDKQKQTGDFIERQNTKEVLAGEISLHLFTDILVMLAGTQRMEERGIDIEGFIARGFDGIVLLGSRENKKLAVKINLFKKRFFENKETTALVEFGIDKQEEILNKIEKILQESGHKNFARFHVEDLIKDLSIFGQDFNVLIELSELINGLTLKRAIEQLEPNENGLGQAFDLLQQFLEIHRFLMANGLSNRDMSNLKNAVVDEESIVKWVDFGNIIPLDNAGVGLEKRKLISVVMKILTGQQMNGDFMEKPEIGEREEKEFIQLFVSRFGEEYSDLAREIFAILQRGWNENSFGISNIMTALRDLSARSGLNNGGKSDGIAGAMHKKEIGLQGSNIDALINYRIQRWSKWLQDSKDRLKTLNPEQIPAVIIKNEEKLARERENVLSRTLELKNIMKSDNIREFVRALKEVNDGAEKELSLRQEIVLATIAKELKGHPYIDFNPEEILFIPASSWLHDFFEFRGVCGRIMAVNDGTDSGNIILIDESRNKNNLELLNTLIHEIIHKQFRNGGYIVQQARPQERQFFRILEEALTERLARKLTQDIYRRNPQISAKSPEEKLFEIIYGEETAYLSKSYPMEGRFLEEILKALGGNAEEAIFDCLKTGDLTLLRDLLGSRWEKIVAVIEGTNAKSDFYNLGLYIITRSINDKKGERGLDASIKALNIIKRIDIWDVLGEKAVELFNFNPNGEFMGAIVSRAGVKLLDEILGASAADFDSKDIKGKFIEYVRAETLKFIRLKVDFDKAGSRKPPSARTFANYQIGKLAKAEITPDLKLKVTDSKGNVSVLDLVLQGEMDINSLKSQIESMQDIENDHKQLILDILSLLEKSPPKLYNFSTLIEDLFGVASSEHSLIALHYDLSDNPIAAFHEAGEYLISLGLLDIRLEGDVLMVSIKDKKNALILEGKTLSIAQKNPGNPHYLLRALQRAVFKYEDRTLTRQIKEGQAEISKQLVTSSLTNIYQAMVDMYGSEQNLEAMLPKMNILEIGPGQEVKLIGLLKSRGADIVGVELPYPNLSTENISLGLVKQIEGGAAEYLKGVKPGTLDIIYSNHVLEEGNPSIARSEIRDILISSKEALKDDGHIIVQVFDKYGAPSEEELKTLGFIIKRSESLDEGRHYLWVLQKAPQIDSKPEARNLGEAKEPETPPDSKGDVASAVGPDKDRKNSGISSRVIRGFRIEERIMDEIFEKVRQTRPVEVFGILAGSITAEGDVRISEMFDITIKESTEFGLDFDEEEVDKIVHRLQSENKACLFWHSHTPSFLRQGLSIFSPQDINGLQAHGVSGGLIFGDRWAVAGYLKEDATVEYKPIEILRNGNRLEENEISEKYGVQLARYNRHIELSDKELQEDLLEQGIFQSFYSTPYYDPVEIKKYLQTILLRLNSYKKSGLNEIVKKDLEEIEALSLYIRALWRHDIDEEGNVIIPQSNGMKLKAKLEQFVKKEGLSFRFGALSIKEALDLIEKKTAALLINEGTNIESIERPLGVGDVLVNSNKNDINRRMLVYLGATTDYFTPETYSYEFIPLDISGKVTSSKSIRISPFEFSRLRYSLWKLVPSAPLGNSNFSSKEGLFKPGGTDDSTGSPSISRETKNQGRIDKIETPPDSQIDNKELRQIIAKFEGQIEVSPDDVAQYVPEEIKIILDIAKELGLTMALTGGTARDFAIASHLKRKLPMPVLSDIDIAIIPEDGSAVLGYGDWAKEKYELLNEELRKRGYTYKVDFSAGVRTQDTYVFENFMNTKSDSAFGLSRLAAAWAGNKYVIFGTNEAVNDLKNKVLSADIEKAEAPGEGMAAKMIGKAAIYRDFAGFGMDNYLKESILKDVTLLKGQGKDAIIKFMKDIFDYMKVNDKNDNPIERLKRTISEFDLSEVLGFSEEELMRLAQGSPGGIDFRALPIVTQPMPPALAPLPSGAQVRPLVSQIEPALGDLDKEWQEIQSMLNAGMVPSSQRIKDYLQGCYQKKYFSQDIDKILSCIADILRLEEEQVSQAEPALKELLVLLESDKPASEIQLSLAKITILPAILKPVNP